MKHRNCFSTLALVATLILAACSGEEYKEDPAFNEEIKTELVDKSQLPQWLADYITYLEYAPEGQKIQSEFSGVYRFECFDRTFYNIYSPNQSSLYSHLYTAEGAPVELTQTYSKSFADHAKNWTIVYMLNPTKEKPADIIYPVEFYNLENKDSIEQRLLYLKDNNDGPRRWNRPFYAVNSEEQYRLMFGNSDTLPEIDFNQYTLVTGVCYVPIGFRQIRQEINTNGETPVLKVYFEKAQIFNYEFNSNTELALVWALYPKSSFKNGYANIWVNNIEF